MAQRGRQHGQGPFGLPATNAVIAVDSCQDIALSLATLRSYPATPAVVSGLSSSVYLG